MLTDRSVSRGQKRPEGMDLSESFRAILNPAKQPGPSRKSMTGHSLLTSSSPAGSPRRTSRCPAAEVGRIGAVVDDRLHRGCCRGLRVRCGNQRTKCHFPTTSSPQQRIEPNSLPKLSRGSPEGLLVVHRGAERGDDGLQFADGIRVFGRRIEALRGIGFDVEEQR